jgi:hypothetical protein
MPPSTNSPATARPGRHSWTISAVLCATAGIALIIHGIIPANPASKVAAPSRLAAPAASAGQDQAPPAGETVVLAGFQPPPAWVPIYSDGVNPTHGTRSDENGAIKGITTLETSDPLDKIKDYYKVKLTDEGFDLTVDTSVTRVAEHAEITARKDGGKLMVRTIMHRTKNRTTVNVDYTDAGSVNPSPAEAPAIAAAASPNPETAPVKSAPVWVPVYPSVKGEFHVAANPGAGGKSGTLDFASADSVARIRDFYFARFKESGYSVDSGAGSPDGVESAVLKARKDGGRFTALVTIKAEDGSTHISINFAESL